MSFAETARLDNTVLLAFANCCHNMVSLQLLKGIKDC